MEVVLVSSFEILVLKGNNLVLLVQLMEIVHIELDSKISVT